MNTQATDSPALHTLAATLRQASDTRQPVPPLRELAATLGVPTGIAQAYAIQRINRQQRIDSGDRVLGRKIGLTSLAVQRQLGVDQPDFGALWSSTAWADGQTVALASLIQPKVEAEVALVMARDLDLPDATAADVIRATDFALAALEVVDSRIADWKIGLFDTIADNASAAGFVLGADPVRLTDVHLRDARMGMTRTSAGDAAAGAVADAAAGAAGPGPAEVSSGVGSACLGHPLNAAAWLARTLSRMGEPLRAGDIVLTGALGPMVAARAGDQFEAHIEGLGRVAVRFS